MREYPVVLSTCHSLRTSLADGYLLDYLIVDEASQVDVLSAALALSCSRNVVIVGDLQQLPHIAKDVASDLEPPAAAYAYRDHSLLQSVADLYGEDLPRTLLREHYRCDPAIIGFCNKSYYDGALVPFSTSVREQPLVVFRTSEGNHMRTHRGGGHSNRRELDVIAEEVIKQHCAGIADADIGITTPYRRQADKAGDVLDQFEADTVHKFQGRQKKAVILTTVLDESWRGRYGLTFVDDPHLVNVAVSRAVELFVLVTNHGLMPASRHLRDLIGYIGYQGLDRGVTESAVISVFDLLYREHSRRLRALAADLRKDMAFPSEDIIWTVLHQLLEEEQCAHLRVAPQVLLRNLVGNPSDLTPRQQEFVRRRASVDFTVYNRVSNEPLLAVEVDGFAYHENEPEQLARDALKDEILRSRGLPLLRLPTTGSGEVARLRQAIAEADGRAARQSGGPSSTTILLPEDQSADRPVDLRAPTDTESGRRWPAG